MNGQTNTVAMLQWHVAHKYQLSVYPSGGQVFYNLALMVKQFFLHYQTT